MLRVRSCRLLMGCLFAAVVPYSAARAQQQVGTVELAFAGEFLSPEPRPALDQGWFAVARTERGFSLVPTRLQVADVPDRCAGSATQITAVGVQEPLFLVRGPAVFTEGPVDTAYVGYRFIFPGEHLSVRLGEERWFGFVAYGTANPAIGGARVTDYVIRLEHGTLSQTIAEFPRIDSDGPPQLRWAGDLDRDGLLDALFDLTTSYAGHRYVLFLSSGSAPEQLVGRAAEFAVSGC